MIYHSAVDKYNKGVHLNELINEFEYNNNKCFTHDIIKGVPNKMYDCDCIYFEPFWEHGFKSFKSKSKVDFNYNEILIKINESAIIQNKMPANAVSIDISTNCDPMDVKKMAAVFLNWYMQVSGLPVAPPPVEKAPDYPPPPLGGENG